MIFKQFGKEIPVYTLRYWLQYKKGQAHCDVRRRNRRPSIYKEFNKWFKKQLPQKLQEVKSLEIKDIFEKIAPEVYLQFKE